MRLLVILSSIILSIATPAMERMNFLCQSPSEASPDFTFDHHSFDFGKFPKKKKKTHTFVFTNTGNASLLILHVATGCGCTTTSYTQDPIQPGKKGEIKVQYDGSSQRLGPFRKTITVYTNSRKNYTRLVISGETIEK